MSNTPHWFGSDLRSEHCKEIDNTHFLKRPLLCLLSFRTWRLAKALDKAALHFLKVEGDDEGFDRTLRLADTQWAKIYNIQNRSRLPREKK